MASIMNIGMRSLMAYQAALSITSQNIEYANVPYYSRREIDFNEAMFNNGITIGDVRRVVDENINNALVRQTSSYGRMNLLLERFSDFEKLVDDDKTNITKFLNDSLTALQQLCTDVGSTQSRSVYLSQLNALASRFRTMSNEIQSRKNEINGSITAETNNLNNILQQVAEINKQISTVTDDEKGPLLDQRFGLMQKLGEIINFKSTTDDAGIVQITLDNGLELVTGSKYFPITAQADTENPMNLTLVLTHNNVAMHVDSFITEGRLVGLLQFKQTGLDEAQRGLDRLSLGIASLINQQNKLGVDLNGNLGTDIFSDINDPTLVAARALPNLKNTGTASMGVTITDVTQLTTSDCRLVFDSATHYTLTRLSDNSVVTSGNVTSIPATISADGFRIDINSASIASGDSYLIKPTKDAASKMQVSLTDPSKLALGFPVSCQHNLTNKGTGEVVVGAILDTANSAFSTPKQLNPPIRIEFLSPTNYQLVNALNNAVIEGPLTYDPTTGTDIFPTPGGYDPGYRISLTGNIKAGDSFDITYNQNPAGDNRNALLLADLYQKNTLGNGTLNFSHGYQSLALDVSVKANSYKITQESAKLLLAQAAARRDDVSGVSLAEEAINMKRYQEAYEASAQVVQVAKTIFDILIGVTRG